METTTVADFTGHVLDACATCRQPIVLSVDARFCSRCGTRVDRAPAAAMTVQTPTHTFTVRDRLGESPAARVYLCDASPRDCDAPRRPAVFKIARSAAANESLKNEATTLRLLTVADHAAAHRPFLPLVVESFAYVDEADETRRVNALAYDAAIASPLDLYSLADVRAAYPGGVDARDAAWMFRRLLSVLAFAHAAGIGHGAVTPHRVLIEPKDHKLVLIGWSCAGGADGFAPDGDPLVSAWQTDRLPRRECDVAMAARTIACVVGGDPLTMRLPASVDAGVARLLERCATGRDVSGSKRADRLLSDFDRLIEIAWGKRAFRAFAMPTRA